MPKLAELIEDKKLSWTKLSTPYWYGDERCILEIVTGTAVWYHSDCAGADPLGAGARSHWRARCASISVHESRCDADGNSWMVREPLVDRNNIPGKPRASRRRNSTAMVRPRYRANDAGVVRNVLPIALWAADPKIAVCLRRDPPPGITNANLHSVMPSPPSEGCSGARRVFQCLGIPRTMWKFQPPSWKDLPTRYATRRKIPKVELSVCPGTAACRRPRRPRSRIYALNLKQRIVLRGATDWVVQEDNLRTPAAKHRSGALDGRSGRRADPEHGHKCARLGRQQLHLVAPPAPGETGLQHCSLHPRSYDPAQAGSRQQRYALAAR